MTWRVDFLNRHSYSVLHSLSLSDGLDDIRINADKIAGTNYFAREPRRVEFTCFRDDWIEEHILSGDYELDRYVSEYLVRLHEAENLIFNGIIDTSYVKFDAKKDTVSFTCYDFLRLFTKFEDQTMIYALTGGYSAGYLMGYMAQGVELALGGGFNLPASWNDYQPLNRWVNTLPILTIDDWKEWLEPLFGMNGNPVWYAGFLPAGGYNTDGTAPVMELRVLVRNQQYGANTDEPVACRLLGRTWRFFNTVCPLEIEARQIDEERDDFSWGDSEAIDAWIEAVAASYTSPSVSVWGRRTLYSDGSRIYQTAIWDNDFEKETAPETWEIAFTGNAIPAQIYPKGWYEGGNEPLEKLKALKAGLMLHNLTIVSEPGGLLRLVNKTEASNTSTSISRNDIIEYKRKRINRSRPDTSVLDELMGDATALKTVVADYYEELFSQTWELEIVVDGLNNYDLSLFERIVVEGSQYRITELQRDPRKDEYKLKAWEV